MKTLLVMRHAKSDWNADYGSDHERPLNDRGADSARLMGKVLSDERQVPDLVITSTAVRALTTAALANEAGKWDADIVGESGLYGGGTDAAVHVASRSPDVDRLMLVGHQPTWSNLVLKLTGERVEMKTATAVVVEFDIDHWSALPGEQGRLTAVFQPRDYLGRGDDTSSS
jgi:phosphohistidine phosphatase